MLVLLRAIDVGITDAVKDAYHPQIAGRSEQDREEQPERENTLKDRKRRRTARQVLKMQRTRGK